MRRSSKQREAIQTFLESRKDHPTADVVYGEIRKEYPNISLGTVYRNLALFVKEGQACSLFPGDGKEHFDGTANPHYHFYCRNCGSVLDLELPYQPEITHTAQRAFPGVVDTHQICFYGLCSRCAER